MNTVGGGDRKIYIMTSTHRVVLYIALHYVVHSVEIVGDHKLRFSAEKQKDDPYYCPVRLLC